MSHLVPFPPRPSKKWGLCPTNSGFVHAQDFTSHFKHQLKVHPNYTKVTSLLSEDYPYFSYIHNTKSKTLIRFKLNSSNKAQLPYKTTILLNSQLHERNIFFLQLPKLVFLLNFVKHSTLSKSLLRTNPTFAQPSYTIRQIVLLHYLWDNLAL